jgi:hypothetical protein
MVGPAFVPGTAYDDHLSFLSNFFMVSFEGNRASWFNNFLLKERGTLALIPLDAIK